MLISELTAYDADIICLQVRTAIPSPTLLLSLAAFIANRVRTNGSRLLIV